MLIITKKRKNYMYFHQFFIKMRYLPYLRLSISYFHAENKRRTKLRRGSGRRRGQRQRAKRSGSGSGQVSGQEQERTTSSKWAMASSSSSSSQKQGKKQTTLFQVENYFWWLTTWIGQSVFPYIFHPQKGPFHRTPVQSYSMLQNYCCRLGATRGTDPHPHPTNHPTRRRSSNRTPGSTPPTLSTPQTPPRPSQRKITMKTRTRSLRRRWK